MTKAANLATLTAGIEQLCRATGTQSSEHIKPINAYCAARLVIEGGIPPEWLSPRPPLAGDKFSNAVYGIEYSPAAESKSEREVLGGIRYKKIDVTAVVNGLGPAMGVSTKSTGNAFRNLTNRMEEAIGECTNIHLMYPGFVFGFLHLIKFSKVSESGSIQDPSFGEDDQPLASLTRYHGVLASLSGRSLITDPGSRYESVALIVYRCRNGKSEIWPNYPDPNSPVHFSRFFQRLYDLYDLRSLTQIPTGRTSAKHGKSKARGYRKNSIRIWHFRGKSGRRNDA